LKLQELIKSEVEMNMVGETMKRTGAAFLTFLLLSTAGYAALRPTPEYLKSAVVYQLVLRTFTREGTFKAATEMLGHVRSVGVDVVYLAPFVEMDRDMDKAGWSPRQIKSGFNSPKNPYRISDYDKIDPEYGDYADFRAFTDKAHELGMKVFMDLVYVHCGPNNVIKDKCKDAFQKNPDGSIKMTRWRFPYINFESKDVRKYLIDSMLRWMSLGCDGFRCDTGDQVPLDFWEESARVCRSVNPELVMINEGTSLECLKSAFDARYDWRWGWIRGFLAPASVKDPLPLPRIMDKVREYDASTPPNAFSFLFLDNHDIAADSESNRMDMLLPVEAGNAAFVLTFLRRGLPLLFNGNEIADNSLSTFFAPVEDERRARKTVNWARALQPAGQKRMNLLRNLAKLRHEMPVFSVGTQEWLKDGETCGCIAFLRRMDGKSVLVAVNLTGAETSFRLKGNAGIKGRALLSENGTLDEDGTCRFGPWGYFVFEVLR
jgi:glycosidase